MTVSATPLPYVRSTRSDLVSQGLCELVGKDALNDAWGDAIFEFHHNVGIENIIPALHI